LYDQLQQVETLSGIKPQQAKHRKILKDLQDLFVSCFL